MNTIDAYEQEVMMQLDELPRVLKELENRDIWLSKDEQSRAVITGSGDSYAAALSVERLSSFRIRCIDPYEFISVAYNEDNYMQERNIIYIISVSGETRASIYAAKRAKDMGLKVVALTSNTTSRLANLADSIIELRFKRTGILTAGSIGFTTSLLVAASLVHAIDSNSIDIKRLFKLTDNSSIELKDFNYLVGDVLTYPITVYFSAKIYEVLGLKSQYCMLEQFKHMQIFSLSLSASDKVIILTDHGKILADGLLSNGIDAILIGYKDVVNYERNYDRECINDTSRDYDSKDKTKDYVGSEYYLSLASRFTDKLNVIIYTTFIAQRAVLNNARIRGFNDCAFITNNGLLRLSSSLIY
mgnify:CR=1 FL=1